ncbi:MAG: hypothetical protein K1000chlam3_00120 [Chlamydiae bacterium]|nr:hypothetical protein [Chlamydiota bacterium]
MMLSISQLHASYEDLKVYASDKVEKTLAFGKEHKREILLAAGVVATAVLVYYFVLPQLFESNNPSSAKNLSDLGKRIVKEPIIPKSSATVNLLDPKPSVSTVPISLANQSQSVVNEGTCPAFNLPAPLQAISDRPHNAELPSFPVPKQSNLLTRQVQRIVKEDSPIIPTKPLIPVKSFDPKPSALTLPSPIANQSQSVVNEGTCPAFNLPAPLQAVADKPHNSELPSFPVPKQSNLLTRLVQPIVKKNSTIISKSPTFKPLNSSHISHSSTEQTNRMNQMPRPLIEQPIFPKLGPNIFEKIKKTTAESFSNEDRSEEYITRELLAAGFSRSCEKMKGAFETSQYYAEKMKGAFETSQYYAEKMRIVSQPIATWAFRIALPFLIKDLIFNKGQIFI